MAEGKCMRLSNVASVSCIIGLIPSDNEPHAHPLLWPRSDTCQRPDWVRWLWHPRSGDMRVGRVIHHYEFLSKTGMPEFNEWLRGFYFPAVKLLAVRTYFVPRGPYDEFDNAHRRLDARVSNRVTTLLRPCLPNVEVVTGVDNAWLERRFPRLCEW